MHETGAEAPSTAKPLCGPVILVRGMNAVSYNICKVPIAQARLRYCCMHREAVDELSMSC